MSGSLYYELGLPQCYESPEAARAVLARAVSELSHLMRDHERIGSRPLAVQLRLYDMAVPHSGGEDPGEPS